MDSFVRVAGVFLFPFELCVNACKHYDILAFPVLSVGTLYEFLCLLPYLRCLK